MADPPSYNDVSQPAAPQQAGAPAAHAPYPQAQPAAPAAPYPPAQAAAYPPAQAAAYPPTQQPVTPYPQQYQEKPPLAGVSAAPPAAYPQQAQPAYPAQAQSAYPPQAQPAYPAAPQAYPAAPQAYPAAPQAYPAAPQAYPIAQQPAYPAGVPQQQPVAQTVVVTSTTQGQYVNSTYRHIPILPMGLAILMLVLNIFTSGFGTVLAGFLLLCCGHTYAVHQSRGAVACMSIGIGFLQIVLMFWLVGWVWAVIWGVLMVTGSAELYGRPHGQVTATTSTVVVAAT